MKCRIWLILNKRLVEIVMESYLAIVFCKDVLTLYTDSSNVWMEEELIKELFWANELVKYFIVLMIISQPNRHCIFLDHRPPA